MKLTRIAAVSAVLLLAPVMFSACTTGSGETEKPDTPAAQEKPGKEEPAEAVEVKTEAKAEKPAAEPAPAAQTPAEETQPAPVLVPEQSEKPEQKESAPAPAAAKEEKKAALPCEHTVRTGDNLWSLARKYYGTGAKWKLIFDANKENIKNENFLEPGKILKIPAAKC